MDDDAAAIAVLKRQLKPNFDCDSLTSSDEATQVIKDGVQYDVALFGLNQPSVSGLQLLELMRQYKPTVPVVMMSGDARPETIIQVMRQGACDFVVKPVADDGVAKRLNDAVENALSPRAIIELLSVLDNHSKPLPRYTDARQTVMMEFQKAYLTRLMRDAAGNLSAASRLSGIDRANLRRALQKHNKKNGK